MRFIVIIGGVISGLGKGIFTASLGRVLKWKGLRVTAVKIDPYLNVDAGTMNPLEHGEVWVTEDGGEIDQDLGNYERFFDATLSKANNLTSGKVYLEVIKRERRGDYLGKTVQIVPHVVDFVCDYLEQFGKAHDVVLVELGGTVGDLESAIFLEALRRLRDLRGHNVVYVLLIYTPFLNTVGELKTKPGQHAFLRLMGFGIKPDFLVIRSPINESYVLEKFYPYLTRDRLFVLPDMDDKYKIPLMLDDSGFAQRILESLGIHKKSDESEKRRWRSFVFCRYEKGVNIGIVGKYVQRGKNEHNDVYISILEALDHAGRYLKIKPKVFQIEAENFRDKGFDGIIVPGGFGSRGVEGKIRAIEYARENGIPFLGICYGMQLAVVEYARHVLGWNAHTTEVDPKTEYPVIDLMPEQRAIKEKGATMRLGSYPAKLKKGTKVWTLYNEFGRIKNGVVFERHRHRYEVNPKYVRDLERAGLIFSGFYLNLAEFLELPNHPFFVGTQAHPEFTSRPLSPNPLFVGLISAASDFRG